MALKGKSGGGFRGVIVKGGIGKVQGGYTGPTGTLGTPPTGGGNGGGSGSGGGGSSGGKPKR